MGVLVAPSMLSCDFGKLDEQVKLVNDSDADLFHLDIMDGVFVPNISYGFPIVKAIAKNAKKPLDAHLMIVDPDRFIEELAALGVKYLSVHWEACTHLHRSLQKIRSLGMKAGIALNPHTPVNLLHEILPETDFVLIMSVNPGFGGQKFIENSLLKIKKLREIVQKISPSCLIEVDGGVNEENGPALVRAGANILVAGNSVFGSPNPMEVIKNLKKL